MPQACLMIPVQPLLIHLKPDIPAVTGRIHRNQTSRLNVGSRAPIHSRQSAHPPHQRPFMLTYGPSGLKCRGFGPLTYPSGINRNAQFLPLILLLHLIFPLFSSSESSLIPYR